MNSGIFPSRITGTDDNGLPIFDRAVDEEFLDRYFGTFVSNGVVPESASSLKVTPGEGLSVVINPGCCFINGKFGYLEKPETVELSSSNLSQTALVCVERNNIQRDFIPIVKMGTTGVQRDSDVWEIAPGRVTIPPGATQISSSNITDLRGVSAYCGYTYNPMQQIDTTDLFDQYNAAFTEWFDTAKNTLTDAAAGNLLTMIQSIVNKNGLFVNGTPAVESGSNTNGTWTKWYDGTMICRKVVNLTVDCTTKWGYLYSSPEYDLGNFAIPFIDLPTIMINLTLGNGTKASGVMHYPGDHIRPTSASAGGINFCRSSANTVNTNVNILAVGRWK